MILAVIKVDGYFWEIRKDKKKVEIVRADDVLKKIYTNIPCLVADTKNFFIRYMIFDKTEEDASIESTGASLLETKNYYTLIEEYNDKKIAFYIKKPDVIKLFKEFAFSKIIPLDIVLFRMAIKYKAEIVGIIGEKYFSYSRKISFENLETFFANEGEFTSLLFEPNVNIYFFLETISKMLHIKKAIFSDKEISEEELNEKNIIQIKEDELLKIINNEKTFVIKDKFSDNYQSKIYRKILLAISGLAILASPYFFYKHIDIKTKNAYYDAIYSKLKKRLNEIKRIDKRYQIDYLYKIYNPIDFNKYFYNIVKEIATVPGVISYSYKETLFPKKEPVRMKVTIEGIDNFLQFEKKFRKYIKNYQVNPKDKTINVELIINKNKKSRRRR